MNAPPQSSLGREQKAWFLDRLRQSKATWKIWGLSQGTLDWRSDYQNLPEGLGPKWRPGEPPRLVAQVVEGDPSLAMKK